MNRLREKYIKEVVPSLTEKHGYTTPMLVPKIEKIVVNMGVGDATVNSKNLENAVNELEKITGLKAVETTAKKSIASFKVREGHKIGCKVTLRGDNMYTFLDKLISISLPRVRDFRGLSPKSFDGRGNYTIGIKEQIIFPEIKFDEVEKVRGMDIVIVTTAKTNEEAFDLLKELGEKYYLSTPRSKNGALSFFAQVVKKNTIMRNIGDSEGMSSGICVDIHPIEYASDNYMCRCFEAFRSILLRGIACCVRIYKSENKELFIEMTRKSRVDLVLYRIYYLVGFLFSFKSKYFWFYLFDKYTSSKKRTSYMTIPAGRAFYWGELLPTNVFLPPSSGVFEGMEVYLPNDVNSYLFNLYGNYMEIPPEEERERHFYLDFDLGPDYK